MKRKLAIGCLTLILIGLFAAGVFAYRQHRYVERVYARAQAMGVPTSYAELEAMYPMPPEGENAADLYLAAAELLDSIPGEHDAPEPTDASAATYLRQRADAIALIRKAAAMPSCRLHHAAGAEASMDHLTPMRRLTRLMALAARNAAWAGRTDDAVAAAAAIGRLVEHMKSEPLLVGQLTRLAILDMGLSAAFDVAEGKGLDGDQWATLAAAYDDRDGAKAIQACLTVSFVAIMEERDPAGSLLGAQRMYHAWTGGTALIDRSPAAARGLAAFGNLFATGLRADAGTWLLHYIETTGLPSAEALDAAVALNMEAAASPLTPLAASMRAAWSSLVRKMAESTAHARLFQGLCAIERYRLAEGKAPYALDDLVPTYLDAVPIDPFDGNPLRYVLPPDGSGLLYSIGINRFDDGGVISKSSAAGDVVVTLRP